MTTMSEPTSTTPDQGAAPVPSVLSEFGRVCSSAWVCLRRPAFLLPGFAAVSVFAVLMVVGIFISAARPGGSRLGQDPVYLSDLAGPDALSYLAGGMVSIIGSCVLAVAAAHVASPFANGSIRVQLVRAPRRGIWMAGQLAMVAVLSIALTLVAVLAVVLAAHMAAALNAVPTQQWHTASAIGDLSTTTLNLAGSMVGFAMLGALVALCLRSAIAAIGVALCYALFEQLVAALVPALSKVLPAEVLGAFATGGNEHVGYAWGVVGSLVVIVACAVLCVQVLTRRDVVD